jgi:hypothetical protein
MHTHFAEKIKCSPKTILNYYYRVEVCKQLYLLYICIWLIYNHFMTTGFTHRGFPI